MSIEISDWLWNVFAGIGIGVCIGWALNIVAWLVNESK